MINFNKQLHYLAAILEVQQQTLVNVSNIYHRRKIKQQTMNTKTLGEQRQRIDFTPGTPGNEYAIKQKTAELTNILEAFRTDERYQHSQEILRLIDEAQKGYEQAAMWAVKAVTGELKP